MFHACRRQPCACWQAAKHDDGFDKWWGSVDTAGCVIVCFRMILWLLLLGLRVGRERGKGGARFNVGQSVVGEERHQDGVSHA